MKVNGWYFQEKQPDAVVAGCVAIYENMWPDPHLAIQKLEDEVSDPLTEVCWSRAPTIDQGVYQNHRTNKFIPLTTIADTNTNQTLFDISNTFYSSLMVAASSYRQLFSINEELIAEPYSVLKYDEGTEYKIHYDGAPTSGRHVSAICYLNNNYSGGELEFVNFKVKIKPEPGMLIMFPSNFAYSHIAHPITSGSKYAVVTWMKDRF